MSFSKISALAGVLSLASSVAAHGHVPGLTIDGKWVDAYNPSLFYNPNPPAVIGWSALNQDNGFVEPNSFGTSDIACHKGSAVAKASATVAAGSTIDVHWNTWPDSHKGPVLDYLAPVDSFEGLTAGDLSFFKFAEKGLVDGSSAPGKWAADELIANNNTWTVTIPADIAPGKYVYRHEIIALHGSGSENGAQNYPQCFNLEITGSGSVTPATTPATKLYTKTDPGILISIYQALGNSYVIPGPAVYSGSGSAPVPSSPAGTSAPVASPTAAPEETSAPVVTPAPTASATIPPYSNSTIPAPTSSKSKSACKSKTRTSVPTAIPTGSPSPVETAPSGGEPSVPTVTVIPTPVSTPTGPSGPISTGTPGESETTNTLPAGTKLSTVLAWISNFYATHGDGEYTGETALKRRTHARHLRF